MADNPFSSNVILSHVLMTHEPSSYDACVFCYVADRWRSDKTWDRSWVLFMRAGFSKSPAKAQCTLVVKCNRHSVVSECWNTGSWFCCHLVKTCSCWDMAWLYEYKVTLVQNQLNGIFMTYNQVVWPFNLHTLPVINIPPAVVPLSFSQMLLHIILSEFCLGINIHHWL